MKNPVGFSYPSGSVKKKSAIKFYPLKKHTLIFIIYIVLRYFISSLTYHLFLNHILSYLIMSNLSNLPTSPAFPTRNTTGDFTEEHSLLPRLDRSKLPPRSLEKHRSCPSCHSRLPRDCSPGCFMGHPLVFLRGNVALGGWVRFP